MVEKTTAKQKQKNIMIADDLYISKIDVPHSIFFYMVQNSFFFVNPLRPGGGALNARIILVLQLLFFLGGHVFFLFI